MEKDLEIFAKKADKAFHQLYEKIFSFLDFSSLMQALSVSQDFYHLLNNYFKSFLKTNNLIADSDIKTEVDEHYYLKLFRAFYAREVLVGQLSSIKNSYSEIQLVRYPRCSTYGVKDFSMGTKFTVFHLYNNDIIFLKNEEYLNPLFNMKNINRKNIRKNVSKFSTASNDLFYLTSSGHLHVIFCNADRPSAELNEGILDITINKPLTNFGVSYPHVVLLFKVPEKANQQKNIGHEEQKEDKAQKHAICQDIKCLDILNLAPEDFNSPERLKKVEGLDDQLVISFCVGTTSAYFLTEKNKVYECDFNAMNNDKYMIFPFEHLKTKMIRRLWSGKNFFFALEQNENPSIHEWSQKEILQWASSKDFGDFLNILKYENVSGNDLVKADKEFLIDRLGMQREDLQVKFMNEIDKVSKKTYTRPRILGWGNNAYGQLGLNTGHVVVNHPSEVKQLPELERGDHIEDIECGAKATAIITQKGRVWITEIPPTKKVAPPKEEEEITTTTKGKKKKKESIELPKEKEEKPFVRWLDLTPICEKLKDGRQYKVIKITLSKDYFAVLGANCGQKKKGKGKGKEEEEEQTRSVKLKGADHICDRLQWDKSLNKDDFVVGYEDRFLGILEIPFNEFALKIDIPSHRIKFFKRKGEIVWDRTNKVNII